MCVVVLVLQMPYDRRKAPPIEEAKFWHQRAEGLRTYALMIRNNDDSLGHSFDLLIAPSPLYGPGSAVNCAA